MQSSHHPLCTHHLAHSQICLSIALGGSQSHGFSRILLPLVVSMADVVLALQAQGYDVDRMTTLVGK